MDFEFLFQTYLTSMYQFLETDHDNYYNVNLDISVDLYKKGLVFYSGIVQKFR